VRIVRIAEETFDDELDVGDGIRQFNEWAAYHLLGPDLTETIKLRDAIRENETLPPKPPRSDT